jgi:hypothetical protein
MNRKVVEMNVEPIRTAAADEWVNKGEEIAPAPKPRVHKDKRLTVNVPGDMHRRLKLHCVATGILMNDFIEAILKRELAKLPPVNV